MPSNPTGGTHIHWVSEAVVTGYGPAPGGKEAPRRMSIQKSPAAGQAPPAGGRGRPGGGGMRASAGGQGVPENDEHPEAPGGQADPPYRVAGPPGGDQGAHQGESEEGREEHQAAEFAGGAPVAWWLRGWGVGQGQEGERAADEEHGQREARQRPRQPGGSGGVYPADTPIPLALLFCHNSTLPEHRLLFVTMTGTREKMCFELRRTPYPRSSQ